ncbi:MAG: hypothetical protein D6741_16230, partial [Planctomycetota bacterium]
MVYAVEDAVVGSEPGMNAAVPFGAIAIRRQAESGFVANRLAAYDLESGKLRWHVGGDSQLLDLPLEGTYFLGPPLPQDGKLYVLGRKAADAYLFVLDAETGSLIWQQQLAVLQDFGPYDPVAQAGLSPVYSEGILVCRVSPTVVVTLDVTTRSLMWAFVPAAEANHDSLNPFVPRVIGGRVVRVPANQSELWDYTPIVARNRVLLPNASTGGVVCLDLMTGEQIWEYSGPEQCLFVGCATERSVFLITKRGALTLSLDDGAVAGNSSVFHPGTEEPAGFGYFNGKDYYQPVTSGEIAVFDVATGKLKRRLTPPSPKPLGNLVVYDGKVVSQTVEAVEAFYDVEALRQEVDERLRRNSHDGRAWFARAVLALQEDRIDQAQEAMAGFLTADAPTELKHEMAVMILNGAQRDFPRFEKYLKAFQPLLTRPEEQIAFELVVADGETEQGRYKAAWSRYLATARRILQDGDMLLEPSPGVRRSAAGWVGQGARTLVAECREPLRTEMTRQVGEILQTLDPKDGRTVQTAARCFAAFDTVVQPWLLQAARGLVEQAENRLLGRQLLVRLGASDDALIRAQAHLQLAKTDDLAQAVAYHLAQAEEAIQFVEANDSERARELSERLSEYRQSAATQEEVASWPTGRVEIHNASQPADPQMLNKYRIAIEEDFAPFAEDWTLDVLRSSSSGYRVLDGGGRVIIDLSGIEDQQLRQVDQARIQSWIVGDVLVVDTGFLCAAFDL